MHRLLSHKSIVTNLVNYICSRGGEYTERILYKEKKLDFIDRIVNTYIHKTKTLKR